MIRLASALAVLVCAAVPAAAFETTGNAIVDGLVRGFTTGEERVVDVGPIAEEDGALVIDFLVIESDAVDIGSGAPLAIALRLSDLRLEGALLDGDVLAADRLLIAEGRYDVADDLVAVTLVTTGEVVSGLRLAPSAFTVATDFEAFLDAFDGNVWGPSRMAFATPDGSLTLPVDGQETTVDRSPDDGTLAVSTSIERLVVDLGATPVGPVLAEAGLSPLELDGRARFAWDREGATLALEDLRIDAANVGALVASGRFLTVPDPGGTLERFTVTFRDAGGTRALLGLAGAMQGMSADAMATFAANTFAGAVLAVNDMAFATEAADAVRRFLTDPRSLSIALDPPVPLPFADMGPARFGDPAELVRAIGISVSAD